VLEPDPGELEYATQQAKSLRRQASAEVIMNALDFSLRLGAALLMGACVGLERQLRQRMAGTRTNALVEAGAAAFVMCAFMVRDHSRGEAQIVSYVVSGVGFLGAGVIFKDAGSVRGLNTAATIWCSAAVGARCGLGSLLHALILALAVLSTNVILRPLAYRLYPSQTQGAEQEVTYAFELICRPEDESHMRALLLQAMSRSPLTLTALRSEDIEGTNRMRVTSQIKGIGRQDEPLEQLVVRLSLEAGVSAVSWSVHPQVLE
jgi:putative Mg2+ transporter-C (MgtC) family protein